MRAAAVGGQAADQAVADLAAGAGDEDDGFAHERPSFSRRLTQDEMTADEPRGPATRISDDSGFVPDLPAVCSPASPMGYDRGMFKRQRTGSVVCPSCGNLVGVNDERCYNCGRWNPGMFGFAPLLRRLGNDFGFTPIVIGACATLYVLTLLASGRQHRDGRPAARSCRPSTQALFLFGASGAMPGVRATTGGGRSSAPGWLHGSAAAHPVQHDVDAAARARRPASCSAPSRARHHLHRRRARSGSSSARSPARCPASRSLGGAFTLGASAPSSGLLGALVRYGQRTGSSLRAQPGVVAGRSTLFVFGLIMPGVDNWAHARRLRRAATSRRCWLDPLQRERTDHMVIALACLALTRSLSVRRVDRPGAGAAAVARRFADAAAARCRSATRFGRDRAATGFPARSPGTCRSRPDCV